MPPAGSVAKSAAPSGADAGDAPCSVLGGPKPSQGRVRALACRAGFTEAGMVSLPHAATLQDAARFTSFIEKGRAGAMAYLARRNDKQELVRSRVDIPFPWARSVVVCLSSYHAEAPLSIAPAKPTAAWVARYAWTGKKDQAGEIRPSDYHKTLLKRLRALEAEMGAEFGKFECRAYVDTGPVVERAAARAAGLGWTGKNTCLIHPKLGSWNFLAVLVTSLELAPEQAPPTIPDRCGSCRRCLDACPTQALIEPYQMDASRCISYLTIEHRGEIQEDLRAGMGRQVFGCDICQDVCPWNRKAPIDLGAPDLTPREELINPDFDWLADLDFADFERLFNGSPIRRAGFLGLRRNIAIAMGNSGLARYLPKLERWANDKPRPTGDASHCGTPDSAHAVVRGAARWAVRRIAQIQRPENPESENQAPVKVTPDELPRLR